MTGRFDPLETSALITTGYRRYLRSLLPVRDPRIATALDYEITHSDLLVKGPLLEATPPYEHGATLDTLIGEGVLSPAFRRLGSEALPLGRPLYVHQEQAIRKVTAGRNVVAHHLFDAPFEWIPGDPARQDLVRASRKELPKPPFWGPLDPAGYLKVANAVRICLSIRNG
jgi:hypothetical protein